MMTKTCDGERWTQEEIDAIERAKEQQRRREKEASQLRDSDKHTQEAGNVQ
jgi:hypothetical protein